MSKPPTQVAAPGGINAHGAMGAANNRNPQLVLRERAKEPRFRQFIATRAGLTGPMNEARTIEAVFRLVGADSWSGFMTEQCVAHWRGLLTEYGSTF